MKKQTFVALMNDSFWRPKIDLFAAEGIAYQWRVLNDAEPGAAKSHSVRNFKIAAGLAEGEHYGKVFQDSDLAKWIEAASYSLFYHDSPQLRSRLEEVIGILEKAQQSDGYLNTYYTIKEPENRFKNIENGHELYCAGHMLEAAVAYYDATGSSRLLNILSREVDYFLSIFGKNAGQLDTYPGHEEIELALAKAFERTGDEKYLDLAEYFINSRGVVPGFLAEPGFLSRKERFRGSDYYQAHAPIREQMTAEGHAVRAMYLFSGAAEVARLKNDDSLRQALYRLWDNVTGKRMYVTGSVGSLKDGERFSLVDYDLPPDIAYAETCAAIGLAMWAYRMLKDRPEARFADIMERVLYNGVLSGVSHDGRHYFYVNPLKIKPAVAKTRPESEHVKPSRVKWFGTACCPPNVMRTVLGIGSYVYTQKDDDIYMHLYAGHSAQIMTARGELQLSVCSEMPWKGGMQMRVSGEGSGRLWLRVPDYARGFALSKNGNDENIQAVNGYVPVDIAPGDVIEAAFSMEAQFVHANPNVDEIACKAAVLRGPLVYCAEEADNFPLLSSFRADAKTHISEEKANLFGGIVRLTVQGDLYDAISWGEGELYRTGAPKRIPAQLHMIPYSLWNNRGEGEMAVWLNII
jgi:DUF1680 family protein